MGFLLKQALKIMCGSNQWSYAAFWKIGCQNTKLLIWEECHCQILPCSESSGSGNSKLPYGEWEGGWGYSENFSAQSGNHREDRLYSLINKMMSNNQISLVGEGIVGRAAFTGNYQWILLSNYTKYAYPPEVLNELYQQSFAGMQTIAVIPILPHGVVLLGSSYAITENLGFVNEVKSLILQLGAIPGALLSENYDGKDPVEKIGVPVSVGMAGFADPSRNCEVIKSSLRDDNCYQKDNPLLASRIGMLSNSLFREIQSNHLTASSTSQHPHSTQALEIPHHSLCKPKLTPKMKPNIPSRGNLEYGHVRAEVILTNPETRLHQQSSSSSVYNCHSGVFQSSVDHRSPKVVGNQSFSGVSAQHDAYNCSIPSNNCNMSQLVAHGGKTIVDDKGSLTTTLIESRQSNVRNNSGLKQFSVPVSLSNDSMANKQRVNGSEYSGGIVVQNALKSKSEEFSLSEADCLTTSSQLLLEDSSKKELLEAMTCPQTKLAPSETNRDNDLFEALNTTWTQLESTMSNEYIPGLANGYPNHISGFESPKLLHPTNEKMCALPSSGDDLFDILGLEYKSKLLAGNWNRLPEKVHNGDGQNSDASQLMNVHESGLSSNISSTCKKISEPGLFSTTASDQLLDAVVSRGHSAVKQSSDDSTSCRTTVTKISSSSVPSSLIFGQPSVSNHMQRGFFGLPKPLGEAGHIDNNSVRSGSRKNDLASCSQSSSVYGSQINSWVELGDNLKRDSSVSTAFSKRPDEVNKSSRKRLKPGETPRPRPKDRQMIQDRVKELREIVPNGAKCSIDALLERTIKHMLFLQSVTKHADKLKQTGESKIISKEGGLFLKDNFEGGATWAFEVGSQTMVCPIIVEDLNPPRQMLVEMLCEQRGFFLEIADLIRGMGLTILKGVMEARDDKIWARFAVEANRDVTRMEIFMSLVHLLEQTLKGNASMANNAIDNSHMIIHNSFPQPTPIPATGRPGSLQ